MTTDLRLDQKDISIFKREFEAIEAEIGKSVIGYKPLIRQVLIAFFSSGHVLLEGVPGVGKTHLVKTLAQAMGLRSSRIQFTPDLMPADIIGTDLLVEDAQGGRRMEFRQGPVFTHVLLADEINRAMPKTQSAMLEAMAEQQVTAGGKTRPLTSPFFVLATQNPLEMEGTYPLPEAQVDRFFFKLLVPYPDKDDLSRIIDLTTGATAYESLVSPILGAERIQQWWGETSKEGDLLALNDLSEAQRQQVGVIRQKHVEYLRGIVRGVLIDPDARDYILNIVMATHEESQHRRHKWFGRSEEEDVGAKQYIAYGASPRGAQALVLGAKVLALLDDRAIVTSADIQQVAIPALRHRLILNFEAESEEKHADDLLSQILERVSS
jgi:MoxR-like ATPase